ncbi:sensor histidine kinase [Cellulomonas soli]|uniref:sensor histidine kinase n=1 Tax=Cellulomonas soli TaxID=931535 RepID=UPI003F84A88A
MTSMAGYTPMSAAPRLTRLSRTRRVSAVVVLLVALPVLTAVAGGSSELSLGSDLLLYVLLVVVVASVGGIGPGVLAALASALTANWFLIPPRHTLAIESRDAVLELVVFLAVSLIVSVTVELAARERATAGRTALEARVLADVSARAPGDLQPAEVLDEVRRAFSMTAVALVRSRPGRADEVVASVGALPEAPAADAVPEGPAARLKAGDELELVAHGPVLFAEDRGLLQRLAAAAGRAWEGQRLAAHAVELAETDRMRAALLAAVGHDLRTPLAGLKAAVSSLRQDDVEFSPDERSALLESIEESTDHLTDIIANLLDISRIEAGAVSALLAPVALDEVVARTLLHVPVGQVDLDLSDSLPLVRADAGLLDRVVANLVDNARRHTPQDVPVEVRARLVGDHVDLQVRDHGPGVPREKWDNLFVPFQRLDDKGVGGHTGLGLAIARGFCDAMDARLTPSQTPGGGLTMTVRLPVEPVGVQAP